MLDVINRLSGLLKKKEQPSNRQASKTVHSSKAKPVFELKVIPESEHHIDHDLISPSAIKVLRRLHEKGYRACLVGGSVRDLLLGHRPKDFDVATDAEPEQVKACFRNSRIIGRRFRLVHVFFGRETIEVATFRGHEDDGSGNRHTENGRLVRDNVFGSIEEDAIRRDFTINALYYDYSNGEILEYTQGFEDLAKRELVLIGDPVKRYQEDPVRMLRAIRFASKLDFSIAKETAQPIESMSHLLSGIAPARLFDECLKLFMTGHAEKTFQKLHHYQLLDPLFPMLLEHSDDLFPQNNSLLKQALVNTDHRIAIGKSVTPGFLFAALLWKPLLSHLAELEQSGLPQYEIWQKAADRTLAKQVKTTAIPKRFTQMTRDVWLLQGRFKHQAGKRAWRLYEHPKFRAAYDFLLLRCVEDSTLQASADWWTETQTLSDADLTKRFAPKRKKRKPAPKAASPKEA